MGFGKLILVFVALPLFAGDPAAFSSQYDVEALPFFKTYNLLPTKFGSEYLSGDTIYKTVYYSGTSLAGFSASLELSRNTHGTRFIPIQFGFNFRHEEGGFAKLGHDGRKELYKNIISSFKKLPEEPDKIIGKLLDAEINNTKINQIIGTNTKLTSFISVNSGLTAFNIKLD